MKKTIILLSVFVSTIIATAQTRTIKFTEAKWAEITALSLKEKKPIFVDCFTTWCGPCKWLAKNVFTKDEVADYYDKNFICVEIDMEKGEGIELAKKWGVRAYPTLIFADANSEVIHRHVGVEYKDDFYKDFIQLGKDAQDPNKQFASVKKMVESGKADAKTHAGYVLMLHDLYMDFQKEMDIYFATQKDEDLKLRYNWTLLNEAQWDYYSREIKYLMANQPAFEKLFSADTVTKKISDIYVGALNQYASAVDIPKYNSMKELIRSSGMKDPEKIILSSDMKFYKTRKDWDNYSKSAITYTDKYSMTNANALNSIAWDFYEKIEDKMALAHAEGWAKHAVELQPDYANTDTYAAVLFKLGKTEEAKKQALAAVELAKKEKTDYKSTQELLDKMNGMK